GWSLDGEAALFGTIYVYHGEEIVNGLFVVLANDAFAAELATRSWWDGLWTDLFEWLGLEGVHRFQQQDL
ncbi:MAG TPA: hypothetical protein VF210_01535, partial [Pseudomonadales bacterium]